MEKIAMKSHKDGKRIMFSGYNNFGPGSYDQKRSMHKFSLSGPSIIPVTVTKVTQDHNEVFEGKPQHAGTFTYNAIELNVWEN